MRLAPVAWCEVTPAGVPEVLAHLEARGGLCLISAAGAAPSDDLFGGKRESAGAAVGDPIAHGAHVLVALTPDTSGEPERLAQLLRHVPTFSHLGPFGRTVPLWRRGFGRADDRAVFVDPHAVWDIDDAEELIDAMGAVDKRRVVRLDLRDQWARCFRVDVQRDGHDFQSTGMKFV